MAGWIKLHRDIRNHWIWDDPLRLKWWLDLLMLANHKEGKTLINGVLTVVEVGEHHTSELKLSSRWNANRKTVHNFLQLLEKDGMITVERCRHNGTTIKVSNYGFYQDILHTTGTTEHTTEGTTERTSKGQRNGHKQEYKNKKEYKSLPDSSHFDKFWSEYPRKVAKKDARKAFARLYVDEQLLNSMLSALERDIKSDNWRLDDGKYIPYPATWLNGERWEDEGAQVTIESLASTWANYPEMGADYDKFKFHS